MASMVAAVFQLDDIAVVDVGVAIAQGLSTGRRDALKYQRQSSKECGE